jgi:hypothetical protein
LGQFLTCRVATTARAPLLTSCEELLT